MRPSTSLARLALLPLLLAGCGYSPPAEQQSASSAAGSAASTDSTAPAPAEWPALPDFADPAEFLSLAPLRWTDWERPQAADHEARLRALGIRPIRGSGEVDNDTTDAYDPNGERPRDYHLVDFTGDGTADVVYDGAWYVRSEGEIGAREGTHTRLFQVMNGRAVEVGDIHGSIQRRWPGRAGEPLSFRTVSYGCCSDPQWAIEYYRPTRTGDTVRFEAYHRVLGRAELRMPERFLDEPRRFTVNADRYLLRDAPVIRDQQTGEFPEWTEWEGHGNAMAEYGRGARGVALAEQADATGRLWWFVLMDARTPPRDAQVEDYTDEAGRRVSWDRLGWMSSRFLQVEAP